VLNSVRQGAILSPVQLRVYFDNLFGRLSMGCHIGPFFVGALAYAADLYIVLSTPSANAMRRRSICCRFVMDMLPIQYNVVFNAI